MKVVILPGYSYQNREEMLHIKDLLTSADYDVYAHEWMHWHNPNQVFDYRYELPEIKEVIKDEYALVAKSIGGYVGLKLIESLESEPQLGVFMGVGALDLEPPQQEEYRKVLTTSEFEKVFVHNTEDNHGGVDLLKEMLKDVEYELIEREASDHRYDYPDLVLNILNKHTA